MKTIIVTGGRKFSDCAAVKQVLDMFEIELIVQGGATGADTLARAYAIARNIKYVTIEANWKEHGRAAESIRNKEMLERYPNAIVIAFPGGKGAANCIKQALSKDMAIIEVK